MWFTADVDGDTHVVPNQRELYETGELKPH